MHTAIGRLLRCTNSSQYEIRDNVFNDHAVAEQSRTDCRIVISDVPHYVADAKIKELAESDAAMATLDAMAKAGIRNLPFDPILIEYTSMSLAGRTVHNFIRLQTRPLGGWAEPVTDAGTPVAIDTYAYIVQYQRDPRDPDNILIASLPISAPIGIKMGEPGRAFTVLVQTRVMDERDVNVYTQMEYEMHLVVAEAMSIAMLMLNTKGIEHVRVDTTKLNKARLKRNEPAKPRINPYTVLRIGHVYDRQGNAHSIGGSGRHMPVHWRAGHVRNMPYGSFKLDVRPTRPRFIPPCLVNFDPLNPEDAPQPKREVTV